MTSPASTELRTVQESLKPAHQAVPAWSARYRSEKSVKSALVAERPAPAKRALAARRAERREELAQGRAMRPEPQATPGQTKCSEGAPEAPPDAAYKRRHKAGSLPAPTGQA